MDAPIAAPDQNTAPPMSVTDAAGAAANQVAPPQQQPQAADVANPGQSTATGGPPAPAAPPQKPSLWKSVLMGALTGLAGSAGSKSFGGGAAGGAGAELQAQGVQKAQANQDQKDQDEHMARQAQTALAMANVAEIGQRIRQMDPNDASNIRAKAQEQTDALIKSGALVYAGQPGSYADVLKQVGQLHQSDPSSIYMPVETAGTDGKMTWQAVKANKAPIQTDIDIPMPDGTKRTLKAGTVTGDQVAGLMVNNIKTESANMSKPKPVDKTYKVVPVDKSISSTGFAYMSPDATTGRLTNFKGEAPAPSAQQFSQTKTVDLFGNDGYVHKMGFDPKTNSYSVDMGFSGTGAQANRASQATTVAKAGEDMISTLTANKDKLGTLATWVQKNGLNTPIADPALAGLQAQLASFSALQPAMHGFRSTSALETFEKVIGGLQQNPDATIASIRGILKVTSALNPALNKATQSNTTQPPMVTMVAPNGQEKAVPPEQVDHYKKLGAKVKVTQ